MRARAEAAAHREARWTVEMMVAHETATTGFAARSTATNRQAVSAMALEPIAGLAAAQALELAAHSLIEELIRIARQAWHSWNDIGEALGLHRRAVVAGDSLAKVAFDYALSYQPSMERRTFTWRCLACDQLVTDHGPSGEPFDREEGHADRCGRWATELEEWHSGRGVSE
jgi:hypothetical protein